MDKAQYKPYLNLLVNMLHRNNILPSSVEDDAYLIRQAHRFVEEEKPLQLGMLAIGFGWLYSLKDKIEELDATKEEVHQFLDNRDIHKFCGYVLKLHSTDCKCIGKVAQKIFNEIKYKNISKLLT